MKNNAYKNLVSLRLANFISEYKNVVDVFEDKEKKNGLIHPGEYGTYKEHLVIDLFKYTLPKKYSFCSGFVVNHLGDVSKQCDIIIYDADNSPFLESADNLKFVPQEIVFAVGEIKSKLTISTLVQALLKLAETKAIRVPMTLLSSKYKNIQINPEKNYNHSIMTFLICDEIKGWDNEIHLKIKQKYEENNIAIPFRHNVILDIKNGVLMYDIHDVAKMINDISQDESLQLREYAWFASSFFNGAIISPLAECIYEGQSKEQNLRLFLQLMNNFIVHLDSYYPEPRLYLL